MNSGTLAKLVILALILLLPAIPALAADITVDAAGTCSFDNAWTAAKNNSDTGGCVGVGTYGDDTIILEKDVTGRDKATGATRVTVDGQGNKYTVARNCCGIHFNVETNGSLTVKNLELTNGGGVTEGGSIQVSGHLTVSDSIFHGNEATYGGAIHADPQVGIVVNRSVFYNNSAGSLGHGSAISIGDQARATITNSVFYNNRGVSVISTFYAATNQQATDLILRHVTLYRNKNQGGTVSTTFSLGVFPSNKLEISNSILWGNSGNRNPDCYFAGTESPNVTMRNNIIGNGVAFCQAGLVTSADPLLPGVGDGNTFVPLVPAGGSPAIDAAFCLPEVTQDFRGTPRPQGRQCDIGAYEVFFQPPDNDDESADASGDGNEGGRPSIPSTPMPKISPTLTCQLLAPQIVISNASVGTACQLVQPSGYGHHDLIAAMPSSVVDIWGWVTPNTQVCFQAASGAIRFVDTTASPRTIATLPAFSQNGMVCATVDGAGQVALVPGPVPPAAAASASQAVSETEMGESLSGCMVKLDYSLNMRDAPAGDKIGAAPYDSVLTALRRTPGWFKVDYHGAQGWIAAMYVEPIGACG